MQVGYEKKSGFSTSRPISLYLENDTSYRRSYTGILIGTHAPFIVIILNDSKTFNDTCIRICICMFSATAGLIVVVQR